MAIMPEVFFATNGDIRARGGVRRETTGQPQSLNASIADGDTIGFHIEGSGSVRFLGIDSPEKNFQLPGSSAQRCLDSPEWEAFLTDPFLPQFGVFNLDADLVDHLRARIGPGAGVNHRLHGDNAEQALIGLIQADMNALGQDLNSFRYFHSFSFEIFDSFGRYLAFINRNQPDPNNPGPRPHSYNERMLEFGAISSGPISIRFVSRRHCLMQSSLLAQRTRWLRRHRRYAAHASLSSKPVPTQT
ncbi:MAG TPA: hypothetical protein VJM12_04545 [Pyrinomonadaceae bacterium]|nr:hypothetical protein [Pyrinomonadaceae bacterium]